MLSTPAQDEDEPQPREHRLDAAPEPTDEELIRRVRAGDSAASALLFDRYLPSLRAKARQRLPAALRAKVGESDVIQDACVAAFASLADFRDRGEGSFGRWLREILDHKIADEVRRHVGAEMRDARREERLPTSADVAPPAGGFASLASQVVAAEDDARLREAIEELPSDSRAAIRWVHEEGLSLAEAGARMGRSADAVRKLYGRALALLANRLDRGSDGAG
jgi:RNA polymerase sigma-70 factor (ECF subfamily)